MAIIDSKAAFRARALAFGIPDNQITILDTNALATFAAFAFLQPYNPTNPNDGAFTTSLTELLGAVPDTGSLARYRRLQFESHTQLLSDTKSRLERTDETAVRRMPAPERAARHREQIRRLVSVQVTQDNEPSYALLDLAQSMVEDAMVKHIALEKCTSRVLELRGAKGVEALADLSSDYKTRQAFLRRSLALDQASLIGFETHERWVNSLYAAMARPPPSNYNHVSWEQVLDADRELFYYLGEECRDGVGLDAEGGKIVEVAMKRLMVDIRIIFLLTPLQSGGSSGSGSGSTHRPSGVIPNISKSQAKRSRTGPKAAGAQPERKGKGKGKGKGKAKGFAMPAGLEGCWSLVDGEAVCCDFQFGKCGEKVADGAKCSKGVHKCCTPRCKGLHGRHECPNKGAK